MPIDVLVHLTAPGSLFLSLMQLAILLPFTFISSIIFLLLTWQSLGRRARFRKALVPGICLGLGMFLARLWVPVPYNVLVHAALLFAVIKFTGAQGIRNPVMAVIFTEMLVIGGGFLFTLAIISLTGKKVQEFITTSALGFGVGTLMELLLPVAAFCILRRNRIALFASTLRDNMYTEDL